MTNDKNMTKKPVIIIDEKPDVVAGQAAGETPVITIEEGGGADAKPIHRRWLTTLVAAAAAVATCVLLIGGGLAYRYFFAFGVPISTSPKENIMKLERTVVRDSMAKVVMTGDSILGVAMNFYKLSGLKAEIALAQPDTTDTNVMLCTRCSDYTASGQYLGSLVVGGKVLCTDRSRVGYCGMANGNVVIGISRSEKVKDYCAERGGAFFRQFVLVSDGVLPTRFVLHGKMERRALGRMADDSIYLVETRHKETLWDFADALREYGFVDAIYITGGISRSWYRSADGVCHDIGAMDEQVPKGVSDGSVPWLVFKRK